MALARMSMSFGGEYILAYASTHSFQDLGGRFYVSLPCLQTCSICALVRYSTSEYASRAVLRSFTR